MHSHVMVVRPAVVHEAPRSLTKFRRDVPGEPGDYSVGSPNWAALAACENAVH